MFWRTLRSTKDRGESDRHQHPGLARNKRREGTEGVRARFVERSTVQSDAYLGSLASSFHRFCALIESATWLASVGIRGPRESDSHPEAPFVSPDCLAWLQYTNCSFLCQMLATFQQFSIGRTRHAGCSFLPMAPAQAYATRSWRISPSNLLRSEWPPCATSFPTWSSAAAAPIRLQY